MKPAHCAFDIHCFSIDNWPIKMLSITSDMVVVTGEQDILLGDYLLYAWPSKLIRFTKKEIKIRLYIALSG